MWDRCEIDGEVKEKKKRKKEGGGGKKNNEGAALRGLCTRGRDGMGASKESLAGVVLRYPSFYTRNVRYCFFGWMDGLIDRWDEMGRDGTRREVNSLFSLLEYIFPHRPAERWAHWSVGYGVTG